MRSVRLEVVFFISIETCSIFWAISLSRKIITAQFFGEICKKIKAVITLIVPITTESIKTQPQAIT
jgi:hypothetical protein